jgi:AraC-like DNA-binding protein
MNGFRVEEVKRRLASSSHDSANLLDLAFEAGFSSKSTFNAAFKKLTGLTPSAYKASLG